MPEPTGDITQLLIAYSNGDRTALDALMPLVYSQLRRIAARNLSRERADHTLHPTALVHEAYLQLVNQHSVNWRNRAQFYGIAAKIMRRILINYAAARRTEKRGGGARKVSLDDNTIVLVDDFNVDLMALDEALAMLAQLDQQKTDVVEMKFFGGMTTEEIAEVTRKSTATIERDWAFARSWLYKTLTDQG